MFNLFLSLISLNLSMLKRKVFVFQANKELSEELSLELSRFKLEISFKE